ncbi:uncharacterized protein LOC114171156 [Vigna unguiculata]|uniref:uncharacterized protein LOC114171156 n=1 Tax=Vigna unguiculata TaxID=3917 RepID=UPI001016A6CB|nr:uncharacterized protein LOC114171156 [Vigna unguiculata]
MIGDDLYKRGYDQSLLKCVTAEQAQYIIKELHEGICGYHSGARTMTTRILLAGYFWPTMEANCPETRTSSFYTIPMDLHKTNRQAEVANKVILVELRKRLNNAKGRWPEELVEVLWAYMCNPQSATNESPFSLVYGVDAMKPVEIGEPSLR